MSYIYISQYLQNAHQKSTERYIWAHYKSLTWMFRSFWVGFPYFSLPFGVTSAEVASFPAAPGWRQVLKESPRWSDMPRRVGGRSCEQFHSMGKPTQNHLWIQRVSKRSSKLDHFLTFWGGKNVKKNRLKSHPKTPPIHEKSLPTIGQWFQSWFSWGSGMLGAGWTLVENYRLDDFEIISLLPLDW